MQLSKKEGQIVNKAISQWQQTQVITLEEANKLQNNIEIVPFDWKRLAKYSFWLALSCIVIAVSSALADEWLISLYHRFFNAGDAIKFLAFTTLSGGFYYWGIKRKSKQPLKKFSNEALFFLGIVTTALAIAYFGKTLSSGSGHFSILLLLAAIIYGLLGLWFPSILVWVFALLSLGSWFGAETGYASGWGAYYLGMNYPMRFVLFGLVLIAGGQWLFTEWKNKADFLRPTRAMGLLYLFIALWILSIFGNYGDSISWNSVSQITLLHWSILFGLAAIAAIYHGIKFDDGMTRGFGLTFIFLNLYTRFFEFFWEGTHKAIFFAILAASFWLLGSKAEKIWQLQAIKEKLQP
jgi:hypothetical protein